MKPKKKLSQSCLSIKMCCTPNKTAQPTDVRVSGATAAALKYEVDAILSSNGGVFNWSNRTDDATHPRHQNLDM